MSKILVVEDDPRQISWARQTLNDHELLIAEHGKSFYNSLNNDSLDLVITDLQVPYDSEYSPDVATGLDIFLASLNKLALKKIAGLALVSNYEHHVHERPPLEGKSEGDVKSQLMNEGKASGIRSVVEIIGKSFGSQARVEHPWNVLFIFDSIHISEYLYFLSPDGQVISKNELPCRPYNAVREKNYLNLKPYREIVEALLNNVYE